MTLHETNFAVAEKANAATVRSWLLLGCSGEALDSIELLPEPSVATQFHAIFAAISASAQEVWKTAVRDALAEWRETKHGRSGLVELTRCVAYFRASDAVAGLGHILLNNLDIAVDPDLRDVITAVIAGLAPSVSTEQTLRLIFADIRFHERNGAQIMIGLAACRPAKTMDFLSYFLETIYPPRTTYYRLDGILTELIRQVSPAVFVPQLRRLKKQDHRQVCKNMSSGVRPAGRWTYSRANSRHAFVSANNRFATPIPYSPRTLAATNDLCMLAEAQLTELLRP